MFLHGEGFTGLLKCNLLILVVRLIRQYTPFCYSHFLQFKSNILLSDKNIYILYMEHVSVKMGQQWPKKAKWAG